MRRPEELLEGEYLMEKKKTFSTMEIILVAFMVGSLLLSFLQSRREEKEREQDMRDGLL